MAAGPATIELVAGESRVLALSPAAATVVTGWTFAFRIAAAFGDAAAVTKTVALGGLTVANATTGAVEVTLTAADTGTTLGAGEFAWELLRTDAGYETVLAWGVLVIVSGITS